MTTSAGPAGWHGLGGVPEGVGVVLPLVMFDTVKHEPCTIALESPFPNVVGIHWLSMPPAVAEIASIAISKGKAIFQ